MTTGNDTWTIPKIEHDPGAPVGPVIIGNAIFRSAGQSNVAHTRHYAAQLLAAADVLERRQSIAPSMKTVANIWSAMIKLGVPMDSWSAEPEGTDCGPDYAVRVDPAALTDSDADWMTFDWDAEDGWTVSSQCEPSSPVTVKLNVPDPFDVDRLAELFRKIVIGEVDDFTVLPA